MSANKKKSKKNYSGKEKRRADRKPVLDSFSFFVTLPGKFYQRLPLHDISEYGIYFDLNTEGEEMDEEAFVIDEEVELQFYLNQSLSVPVRVRVARVEDQGEIKRVGAEVISKKGVPGAKFLATLASLMDQVTDAKAS